MVAHLSLLLHLSHRTVILYLELALDTRDFHVPKGTTHGSGTQKYWWSGMGMDGVDKVDGWDAQGEGVEMKQKGMGMDR